MAAENSLSEPRLQQLFAELASARRAFRAEKETFERERDEDRAGLAEARREAEQRESEALLERQRLVQLRRRFVVRWKKHWSQEHSALRDQKAQLALENQSSQAERERLEEEKARFEQYSHTEKARIQKGWEDLNAEEQDWSVRWKMAESEWQTRNQELETYALHLAEAEKAWQEKESLLKKSCEERGRELVGLEFRIAALREQLPAERIGTPVQPPISIPMTPQPVYLADERLLYEERAQQLQLAREDWRTEQINLVGEFENLVLEILEREQSLDRRETELHARQNQLSTLRRELKRYKKQLKGREAKLGHRENFGLWEREPLEAELRHLHQHRKHSLQLLNQLAETWAKRHSSAREELREEQNRCRAMLEIWSEDLKANEAERAELQDSAIRQGKDAVVLVQTQVTLLEGAADREFAEKLIERYRRRLDRALEKTERDLEERRIRLVALIDDLREAERQIEERTLSLDSDRQKFEAERSAWERDVHLQKDELDRIVGESAFREEQRQRLEAQSQQLRAEIERLTVLLYEESSPQQSRAA